METASCGDQNIDSASANLGSYPALPFTGTITFTMGMIQSLPQTGTVKTE